MFHVNVISDNIFLMSLDITIFEIEGGKSPTGLDSLLFYAGV